MARPRKLLLLRARLEEGDFASRISFVPRLSLPIAFGRHDAVPMCLSALPRAGCSKNAFRGRYFSIGVSAWPRSVCWRNRALFAIRVLSFWIYREIFLFVRFLQQVTALTWWRRSETIKVTAMFTISLLIVKRAWIRRLHKYLFLFLAYNACYILNYDITYRIHNTK